MFKRIVKKFQSETPSTKTDSPVQVMEQTVNSYGQQLTDAEIAAKKHRAFVGGLWDEVGQLQFEFLKAEGLLPEHKLLDVGCGAMRGGVHFVNYLDTGNYFGLDINESLLKAGKVELEAVGLLHKSPNLLLNDKFEFSLFNTQFDFAIALSVFTHLFMNHITRCLIEVNRALKPYGKFYATFFQAPNPGYLDPIFHTPGGITTFYDHDPFHNSFSEMQSLAETANLEVKRIDWSHPRNQKMLCFTKLDG